MESSSRDYSEISDEYDVSSSQLSKSSESSSEEEIGKGKAPAKKKKTAKGDEVNSRTTTRKKKSQDKSLNAGEMEELTSWIYSAEEAIKVEDHLRSTLLSDPRIKNEGKTLCETFIM